MTFQRSSKNFTRTSRTTAESKTVRLIDAAVLLLLIAVLALQWRAASVALGGSLENDQPKHFTSGVMVFDYLRAGLASSPVQFAEEFEVRYPLVAIGHWPPMYYAVQAAFYFLAGPSILSAQILSALMAGLASVLIFLSLRSHTGVRIPLIASACFLATPLVQAAAWQIMSDLLTGVFVYLAILSFAKLLEDPGNWKAALTFAGWAVAALLTKGSAWALGPFFLLAPLLCKRTHFFRSRWFLGSILAVILVGSSFYLLAERTGIGYPANLSRYLSSAFGTRISMLLQVLEFAPPLLLALSVLGMGEALYARWFRKDESSWTTLALVAGAWIASQLIFLFVLPMTPEPRVLLPSLAPAVVLSTRVFVWLQISLRRHPAFSKLAPVLLGMVVVAACGAIPNQRIDGYRQAANAIPYTSDGILILVATENLRGEGAMIAERLSHDRVHRDVILRGSHVLAVVDAAGNDQSRFADVDAVRNYLLQTPVQFIVLDAPPFAYSYQSLIESAVTADPQGFHLLTTVPIVQQSAHQITELRIYENVATGGHHPAIIRTPMGYDAGRRILEYHWR